MERLGQVDMAALRNLDSGHSKYRLAFYYLEFGVLMIRHKVMLGRLMYQHHLINRDENEIIKNVFMKQHKSPNIGDCVLQIIKDFKLMNEQFNEGFIRNTLKEEYSNT